MKFKGVSSFKDPARDFAWYSGWVSKLEKLNNTSYSRTDLETALGKTVVWGINSEKKNLPALVIFPGFRTVPLFWDFDNGLAPFRESHRVFLVDTNGQPCLSDGNTPDIKSNDYGVWAAEVLDKLGLENANVAGASFGGLVCMKLAIVAPQKIKKVVLLNPGCLQTFSMSFRNLYYNMLPIISPSKKNILKFLDNAVFCKPHHQLSPAAEELILDYEHVALTRFVDKGQKPYFMKDELLKVNVDTYLIEGDKDLLFPFETSIANAKRYIRTLKDVHILKNTGHGIETSPEAIGTLKKIVAE